MVKKSLGLVSNTASGVLQNSRSFRPRMLPKLGNSLKTRQASKRFMLNKNKILVRLNILTFKL
jgi:hypothetical protein